MSGGYLDRSLNEFTGLKDGSVTMMCRMPMNIVFASNRSYAEHLAVSMCSLFENNKGSSFDVYIVNADFDERSWGALDVIAKRYGHKLIDVKILDHDLEGLATPFHLSKETYYRLFIPQKLQVPKVLYLDSDIVVTGSICELYDSNVDDCYLGAVRVPGFDRHKDLEMSEDAKYFNAGVMLINVASWRRDHIKERVIDFVQRKPWAVHFADQCGLNSVINGRWKELHPRFNVQGCFFEADIDACAASFPEGELMDAVQRPVIVHYSGSGKPWQFRYKHPYRGLYWQYLRKTPFNHMFSKDLTVFRVIKWFFPKAVKRAVKNAMNRGSEQG
jgi:lipopolysaccharide biosynthesis glycosyltransferase